ncbi:S16 family serine protease [endosymbiont GvMRE of Glomus versiforme]|uniref:S16 family serine protease n=1 Tax=endosymbiont GvMRE of Glomus versiforme TaxID=2039283 RepID=UPI000ED79554|nr:S16 family serine protease [endosymbiont GvMRE of Glomus versiforme]RHZ36372.1 hypothetical protein GvMRE_Ic1g140 [endosymbiont GvMRE of Glomus versiforme]
MKYNEYRKNGSSKWKAVIITFTIIGVLLFGGIIWFAVKNKKSSSPNQANLGEQQNQQTQKAVLQLASNLLGNTNNLNQLTKKPSGDAKTIQEIEEEFLISALGSGHYPTNNINEKLPPEIIERIWWELRPWIEEYLRDLNKSILEHAREKFRRDVENWLKWQQKEYNRQLEEYWKRVQELKKIEDLIREYQKIREQELLDKISRKTELRKKGYVDRDIEKLREWNLLTPDQEIPDLNAETRIGATNILWVSGSERNKTGGSSDLIIFLKPKTGKSPRTEINIDIKNNSRQAINFSIRIEGSHPQKGYKFKEYYEQIVRDFLSEIGKFDNDVYVLIRQSGPASGDSAGIAFYLALYSLVNRVPLPKNLGSTGTVEGKKTGPIGGLKTKIEWNVEKEKPINIFILSEANLNKQGYQKINPGMVTGEPEENWFENFPSSLKEKPHQVHFILTKDQIEIALHEILKEPDKKIVHSCWSSEVQNKKSQKEPSPKNMEIQATPEQLLAFMFDSGFCGISRNEESKNQKDERGNITIPFASSETESLQNILSIEFSKIKAFEKVKNLYNEYKQKLNSNSDADEWYQNELAKLESQNGNEENQEQISELQEKIDRLKAEAATKREVAEQSKINEQSIVKIEKEIEGYKQAKSNEEVILENINQKIEENQRNPNQNPDPNLETEKQEIIKRIDEINEKISSSEAEIANLRQNKSDKELIKEVEELEAQTRNLEEELQKLLRKHKLSNSQNRELETKRRELEQEYQIRKNLDQDKEQIYREYENKFKEIAAPLVNLFPDISSKLTNLGYKKLMIQWKLGEKFGRIHLTSFESSVIFKAIKD